MWHADPRPLVEAEKLYWDAMRRLAKLSIRGDAYPAAEKTLEETYLKLWAAMCDFMTAAGVSSINPDGELWMIRRHYYLVKPGGFKCIEKVVETR